MKENKRFLGLLLVMGLLISSCKNAKMQPEKEELAIRHEIDQLEQARDHEIKNMLNELEQEKKKSAPHISPENHKNLEIFYGIIQNSLQANDPKFSINFLLNDYRKKDGQAVDYETFKKAIKKAKANKLSDGDSLKDIKKSSGDPIEFSEAKMFFDLMNTIQEKITPLSIKIQEKKQELDKIVKPKKQPYN